MKHADVLWKGRLGLQPAPAGREVARAFCRRPDCDDKVVRLWLRTIAVVKQNRHDTMKLVALALAAPAVTGLQFGSKPAAPKGGFQLPAAPALPSMFPRRMSKVPSNVLKAVS